MTNSLVLEDIAIGTLEEGLTWVGRESEDYYAADPIEGGAIRHFCELVEDANPAYYDEQFASDSGLGGLIAPPGSLMVWCSPPLWSPPALKRPPPPRIYRRVPLPGTVLVVLDVDTVYHERLRPGYRLSFRESIKAIAPKETRLGKGCFITVEQTFRRDDGHVVAVQTLTVFRYAPAGESQ